MTQRTAARSMGWLWLVPAVLAGALLFGTAVGETRIPLATIFDVLATKTGLVERVLDPVDAGVIWHYRLSRTVVAACGGASLALSGLILQALLRNLWPSLTYWEFRQEPRRGP